MDVRPQYLTVLGQAVLTADGVGLKVSLTAVYQIADLVAAINQVSDYYQALYLALQNALRDGVGAIAIDDLMANRTQLNPLLLENATTQVADLGLRLISVNIRDLMLPGEVKKLYARVVQARQEGLAQLERARGETAALRNLANAARLANDNPTLLKLRWLQAIERSHGHTVFMGLPPADSDAN